MPLTLLRQARAIKASPQLITRERKLHRLCARCGERPPTDAQTSCAQCLEELRQLKILHEIEAARAREAAAIRAQTRASRPTRTIQIDGREFVVAWDGTH